MVGTTKAYSGLGADIVMESITLIDRVRMPQGGERVLELARFYQGQRFVESLQNLLTLRFLQQVHWQALKPAFHFPRPQLSPIRADVSGDSIGRYSAVRMRLLLVILNAISQLLRRG